MKKSLFRKVVCLILSVTTLFSILSLTVFAGNLKPDSTAATREEMQKLIGTVSYEEYLKEYEGVTIPSGLPTITLDNSSATGNAVKVSESEECITSKATDQTLWESFDWDANSEDALYLPATGKTTWLVTIPEGAASFYFIKINYYNCSTSESSVSTIERKLYIDDYAPFSEASYLSLPKNWAYTNYTVETESTTEADNYSVEYKTESDGYYKIVTDIKGGVKTVTTHKISQDINGNSMAPVITQSPSWNTYFCQDSTGYYHGSLQFYLLNGTRRITLEAVREPVIIKSIELVPVNPDEVGESELPSYEEVKNTYAQKGYKAPVDGEITVLQAEFPDYVSDSSVYATNDNTSAASYPSSSKAQLYNVVGENSYNAMGQWAAYKFTVNKTGLYKFAMRYKQSTLQGMYVCRAIKLSGGDYGLEDGSPSAPFLEAYSAEFNYSDSWQSDYVGTYVEKIVDGEKVREKQEFEFYFEEGVEYTIYLECSLGSLKDLIHRVEISLDKINNSYLKILQLTGNDPDEYRDYKFDQIMMDVLCELLDQAIELEAVKVEFEELCGTNGSHITTLHTIALLLEKMGANEGNDIAANMATLKSYLGTLGTWINDSKKSSMVLDSISVCPADGDEDDLLPASSNFFRSIGFEISAFFFSFFTDYDAMGLTTVPEDGAKRIDVWLATGRDQSQIWRSMIDAQGSFSDSTGVAVALKLVTAGTLLPSILSGKGPDVYIGLGSADVINYAIRDAVFAVNGTEPRFSDEENSYFTTTYYTYRTADGKYEVTTEYRGEENLSFKSLKFDDMIKGNFTDAAMDTLTLRGKTYGIPQTMAFMMMFYRMDVLAELDQEVPETWSDLLAILPVLQTNNMMIGLAYESAFNCMLYQRGINMWKYIDNPEYVGARINLDDDKALETFQYVCRLYSDYSFPVSYDAANRFRTGEMPIIIGDYAAVYNQLVVYATEIAGLWEFTSLPGTVREDGTLNYDSMATIGASVLVHGCDDVLSAWQFIQWQSSAEIQANYGNRMVALIGPSAKYESANVNAIRNMSWTASEREAIEDQMRHLSSIVNYPGSYIITRYTKFAFFAAVNEGADPVESLQGYIEAINVELRRKREEYDLPTLQPGQSLEDVLGS